MASDGAATATASAAPAKPMAPRPSSWRPLLRTAGAGFVGGVIIWGLGDVVGEFTTFLKLRERGLVLANNSQELRDQIGHPYSPGAWYNASIGFSAAGNIAQCTFQLQGTKQITDVTVRGLRAAGSFHRALYNLVGPGTWTVIDCTAMFPSGGGLVAPRSLLPKSQPGDKHIEGVHNPHQGQGQGAAAGGSQAAGSGSEAGGAGDGSWGTAVGPEVAGGPQGAGVGGQQGEQGVGRGGAG